MCVCVELTYVTHSFALDSQDCTGLFHTDTDLNRSHCIKMPCKVETWNFEQTIGLISL